MHVCLLQYIMNYNSKILLAQDHEKTQPTDNSGNILFQKNLSGFKKIKFVNFLVAVKSHICHKFDSF